MELLTITAANATSPQVIDFIGTSIISGEQQAAVALQIRQITRELETLLTGRDKDDLLAHCQSSSWCVTECLDHLTRTTNAFLPQITKAIGDAPKLTRNRNLRTGFFPSLLIRLLSPGYRLRMKVLPQVAPQPLDPEDAWSYFVGSQSELLGALSSAAGLAIDKVGIKSPLYARVNYNVYGAFRMLAAHQSRHVWQIRQILQTLDHQRTTASTHSA
jgi:hypothetical protein